VRKIEEFIKGVRKMEESIKGVERDRKE